MAANNNQLQSGTGHDGDTDDDDWEAEEGLPHMDDEFIQKYLQGRSALIAQERKQRSGL